MGKMKGILGKKLGMTQIFTEDGVRVAVTVIEAGPCVVTGKMTPDRNGYAAVQLGYGTQKKERMNRPDLARFTKAGVEPQRFVREIRVKPEELDNVEVGQTLSVSDVFTEGDVVDVTGISKGKGFQGVIRRYHFRGFRATHGTHEYFRHGGSIGCRLTPGRTIKGKRMPGQMGNERVTTQNVKVAAVRPEENLILIKGSVPGPRQGFVMIRTAAKQKTPRARAAE